MLKIVKMSLDFKLTYIFNTILINIRASCKYWWTFSEICMKINIDRMSKTILKRGNKVAILPELIFKTYNKDTIIKVVCIDSGIQVQIEKK